jgi:hypothetical protein
VRQGVGVQRLLSGCQGERFLTPPLSLLGIPHQPQDMSPMRQRIHLEVRPVEKRAGVVPLGVIEGNVLLQRGVGRR